MGLERDFWMGAKSGGGGGGGSGGWLKTSHSLPTVLMPSAVCSQKAQSTFLKILFTTNINTHVNS